MKEFIKEHFLFNGKNPDQVDINMDKSWDIDYIAVTFFDLGNDELEAHIQEYLFLHGIIFLDDGSGSLLLKNIMTNIEVGVIGKVKVSFVYNRIV